MDATISSDANRLVDRLAIQEVIYRFCRAVDRSDLDQIPSLFHPDATDNHGLYEGDVPGLVEWLRERHKTISSAMHTVSNMLIDFYAPDAALVESYLTVAIRYSAEGAAKMAAVSGLGAASGGPVDMVTYGRYVDQFERRGGEWKIARRVAVPDHTMIFDAPTGSAIKPATMISGRRDQDDLIFKLRRELGLMRAV